MKQFRNELNLSLRDMAGLLGVSYSVISLHEKGLRKLPPAAALELARMQRCWYKSANTQKQEPTPVLPYIHTEQQRAQRQLKACARKAAANAVRVSQALAHMRQTQALLLAKLQFVRVLMNETPPAARRTTFLKILEKDTLFAMKSCCSVRQQMVRYKLFLLNSCSELAMKTHDELLRKRSC
ncbi:MAG TPA: helix-turn-helix transcriptional regulator [Niabella sp.]|nr:helix-turn-helix transcriptional regulator [Niabella sp.]